jgi:hypothetical protein
MLLKSILPTDLTVGNSTHTDCNEWATAATFRELFRLLDAKRILWGSQKRYTAAELKKLINRVRTTRHPFHLPLQVIPETGGLRQRVKVLLDAYSAAACTEAGAGLRNIHKAEEQLVPTSETMRCCDIKGN